jgi:hypothetical protein
VRHLSYRAGPSAREAPAYFVTLTFPAAV